MNKVIYYRNLAIFVLFVALLFATPYLFAQDVTSPTLLRVDNITTSLFHRDNPNQAVAELGQGTVIQLPNVIVENLVYTQNGEVSIYESLRTWHALAREDSRLMPRRVNGRLVYPVRILISGDGSLDSSSRLSTGYMPLGDFLHPNSFNTVRAAADLMAPQFSPQGNPASETSSEGGGSEITQPIGTEDDYFPFLSGEPATESGFSETTASTKGQSPVEYAPRTFPRPLPRPDSFRVPPTPPPRTEAVTNPHPVPACENLRSQVARALGMSVNSRAVNCYLNLFNTETTCRPHLSQRVGNAGNPHAAYGLCSIEASPSVRRENSRGPECVRIQTIEQQTRCCAAMMADTNGRYFGPVIRGEISRCDLL
jgi:hypothetical protein